MRVAVVGASGFVGKALIEHLLGVTSHEVIAISRTPLRLTSWEGSPRYRAVSCDLHNLLELEHALKDVDAAYYLVHSMLPGARLNQGSFADFDLSLADNFGRTARLHHIKHVIYLSGLGPTGTILSAHLKSRAEVETTLRSYLPKLTCLRTGMIVGPQGSSFTILMRLVRRLPIMICPAWTRNRCQIIVLKDVVRCLAACIDNPSLVSQTFDLGAEPPLSYRDMLRETARILGKRCLILSVSFFSIGLSRLWLRLVTGAPKDLVYPLIESLSESMLVRPHHRWPLSDWKFDSFDQAATEALPKMLQSAEAPHAFRGPRVNHRESTVRSIQRLPLPPGRHADWIAEQYIAFLPRFFPFVIKVERKDEDIFIRLGFLPLTLLKLTYSSDRSTPDRQLFYVSGGLLCRRDHKKGRLELRETLGGQACLAAVHDFRPALPWFIYRWTQAEIHRWFMYRLGQWIQSSS